MSEFETQIFGFVLFLIGLSLVWTSSPEFIKKLIISIIKLPFRKYFDDSAVTHESPKKSRHISQKVKDKVWNRDGGKCVECGSNEDLEFDHIIPHVKGGANTYRNIQLLCEPCNRKKSAKIG